MRHEVSRQGTAFSLRPVRIEDAELILELRTDPELARHLNPTPPGVEGQVAYLEGYFERPDEWYFVVEDRDGNPEGVISIYNVDRARSEAEWGQWVLRRGSLAAAESVLLVNDVAFEELGLEAIYTRTRTANEPVISFHDRLGADNRGPMEGDGEQTLIEHRMTRESWPAARERLQAAVERAARLASR